MSKEPVLRPWGSSALSGPSEHAGGGTAWTCQVCTAAAGGSDQCLMGFAFSLSQRHLIQGFVWPFSCLVTGLRVVMRAQVSLC